MSLSGKHEKIIYDSKRDNLYILLHRIGKGSYGQVWCSVMIRSFIYITKSKEQYDYKFVALKINFHSKSGENFKEFIKEIGKFKTIGLNKNDKFSNNYTCGDLINIPLSNFKYKHKNTTFLVIVYELGVSDIKTFFDNQEDINVELFYNVMNKMIKSLEVIHNKGYVINDVKPENFIVFYKDENQENLKNFFIKNISQKINNICKNQECYSYKNNKQKKKKNKNKPNKGIDLNYTKIIDILITCINIMDKQLSLDNHIVSNVFASENSSNYIHSNKKDFSDEEDSDDEDSDNNDNEEDSDEEEEEEEEEEDEEDSNDNETSEYSESDENLDDMSSYVSSIDDSQGDLNDDNDNNTDENSINTSYLYYKTDIDDKTKDKIIKYINNVDNYIKNKGDESYIIYDKSFYYENRGYIKNENNIRKFEFNKKFKNIDVKLIDISKSRKFGTLLGSIQSRYYRSPEVILGYNYDFKSDYWALGLTLLELINKKIIINIEEHKKLNIIDKDIINLKEIIKIFPDKEDKIIDMVKKSKRSRKLLDKKTNKLKFDNLFNNVSSCNDYFLNFKKSDNIFTHKIYMQIISLLNLD